MIQLETQSAISINPGVKRPIHLTSQDSSKLLGQKAVHT